MNDIFDFTLWTDTEKAARIEKLRQSEPIEITGGEVPYSGDLRQYRRNAFQYGLTLRDGYTNKDKECPIFISRTSIGEVLSHSILDAGHIQSIAAIPQIIENSIYITSLLNNDTTKHPDIQHYDYYVCGLKIGGEDYTVKAVVAYSKRGYGYYDHKLTQIEKGKLLNIIENQQLTLDGKLLSTLSVIRKSGEESNLNFDYKNRRLFSILQIKVPKSIGGVELSHEQQQGLLVGDQIRIENVTDKQGKKHNISVQWDADANKLKISAIQPEKPALKSPTPARKRGFHL